MSLNYKSRACRKPHQSLHTSAVNPIIEETLFKLQAPNSQASVFLGTLDPHECLVLGGDFNTTLEERDRSGVETSQAAAGVLREIVDHHSLVDVWRDHHPDDDVTFYLCPSGGG
ncbi:unnamed protein product [Caretta caretta]